MNFAREKEQCSLMIREINEKMCVTEISLPISWCMQRNVEKSHLLVDIATVTVNFDNKFSLPFSVD